MERSHDEQRSPSTYRLPLLLGFEPGAIDCARNDDGGKTERIDDAFGLLFLLCDLRWCEW